MAERFGPPEHLTERARDVWRELVSAHLDPETIMGAELEAFCECVALERDASRRVAEEGTIVADERGRPIPHPAIAIARQAQQDIKGWGDKFQ